MIFFCCDFHLRFHVVNLRPHHEGAMYYSKYKFRSVFGYAYPTYECHKGVEKNKPEIEQLRFWCQNWEQHMYMITFILSKSC
ncbi:putative HVA22 protein g [Trifolium repens]|nr:putative HVA22 protein g [Trifolium repens]